MKIHELLDSPAKWCQGAITTKVEGQPTRYCLVGAIFHCYDNNKVHEHDDLVAVLTQLFHALEMSPSEWNDDPLRTFDEVRALVLKLDI